MSESISVKNINKSFTTESSEIIVDGKRPAPVTRQVLKNLSLSFEEGKINVILGRSGCGKSTLLRILHGTEEPDCGEVCIPQDWHSSLLSAEPYVITWTTLKHNIEMSAGAGRTQEERSALADKLLKAVHLDSFSDMTPAALSTGMKQRLGLARVLAGRSELLLMDEPFASLDFITREELQQELLAIQADMQRTIILVTHQLDEALILADNITIMQENGGIAKFDLSDFPKPRDISLPELKSLGTEIKEACRA